MAAPNVGEAFATIVDGAFWIDAALVLAGFVTPNVLANVVEGWGPDRPNGVYGGAVIAGNEMFVGGVDDPRRTPGYGDGRPRRRHALERVRSA